MQTKIRDKWLPILKNVFETENIPDYLAEYCENVSLKLMMVQSGNYQPISSTLNPNKNSSNFDINNISIPIGLKAIKNTFILNYLSKAIATSPININNYGININIPSTSYLSDLSIMMEVENDMINGITNCLTKVVVDTFFSEPCLPKQNLLDILNGRSFKLNSGNPFIIVSADILSQIEPLNGYVYKDYANTFINYEPNKTYYAGVFKNIDVLAHTYEDLNQKNIVVGSVNLTGGYRIDLFNLASDIIASTSNLSETNTFTLHSRFGVKGFGNYKNSFKVCEIT